MLRTLVFGLRQRIRSSLWVIPALFVLAALVLATALPELDELTRDAEIDTFDVNAARDVLSAIAAGMLSFTGVVVSVLIFVVQFGSAAYSPRLVRRFWRDRRVKVALGTFVATFLYALFVLSDIGFGGEADREFVPTASVSFAILLVLASVVMLLQIIQAVIRNLRAAAIVRTLGSEGHKAIRATYRESRDGAGERPQPDAADQEDGEVAVIRLGRRGGVLLSFATASIVSAARRADVTIELLPAVGDFVARGAPLFRIRGSGRLPARRLQRAVAVGDERTPAQDPGYAFRVLVDIAIKALSPAVNDPTTAVQCLDQLEELLRELAGRELGDVEISDRAGRPRLLHHTPEWHDYLSLATDEIRLAGEGALQVHRRLRALLEDVRATAPEERRADVDAKLALLAAGTRRAFADEADRATAAVPDYQGIGSVRRA